MSALAHVDWLDMVPPVGGMLKKHPPVSRTLRTATLTAILALIALVLSLGGTLRDQRPKSSLPTPQ